MNKPYRINWPNTELKEGQSLTYGYFDEDRGFGFKIEAGRVLLMIREAGEDTLVNPNDIMGSDEPYANVHWCKKCIKSCLGGRIELHTKGDEGFCSCCDEIRHVYRFRVEVCNE